MVRSLGWSARSLAQACCALALTLALLGCARDPGSASSATAARPSAAPEVAAAAARRAAPGALDGGPALVSEAADAPVSDGAVAPVADAPAAPPAPERDDDFVDAAQQVPGAVLELRYATSNNFTKRQLYPVARCLLRRAVARRLARVARRLHAQQRRLLLWDCYRPASIQQALWDLVPDPSFVARPTFAADGTPLGGSRHSRGAAVDLSLTTLDGAPVVMPTDHDDFSAAAQRKRALSARRGGREARRLSEAMIAEGFAPISSEWWHFDAPDSSRFGFSDAPLTECPGCAR